MLRDARGSVDCLALSPRSVELTGHALQRMTLRGISVLDVQLALATAARAVDHRHGTTSHFGQALDGRAIVVVTERDDHDRVVTMMLGGDS